MTIRNSFSVPPRTLDTQPKTEGPRDNPEVETGFVLPNKDGKVSDKQHPAGGGGDPLPPTPTGTHLDYFGGGVLKHPDAVNMYIGDYFKTAAGQKDVKFNDGFMADLAHNKGFHGVLAQYGVGQGSTEKSHLLGGQFKPGQPITQKQIEDMLSKAAANGELDPKVTYVVKPGDSLWAIAEHLQKDGVSKKATPELVKDLEKMNPQLKDPNLIHPGEHMTVPGKRNPQAIYNFVLPPGAVLTMDDGTTSQEGLGGFHSSIHLKDGSEVLYSAICYSKGNNGIDFTNGNARDNVTITESHEIAEAATDPHVQDAIDHNDFKQLGWMDLSNGEIGDIEVNDAPPGAPLSEMYAKSDGYAYQKIWSNEDNTNEIKAKHPHGVEPLPKPTPPPGAAKKNDGVA